MLLLVLIYSFAEPGTNLDLPPADDPTGRWIATGVAVLTVIGPLIAARIQAKKGSANGPVTTVADPSASSTPRLDVTQDYLQKYIASLEKRVEQTEAKNEEAERRYLDLLAKYADVNAKLATTNAQLENVHAANLELRDQLHLLQGQLRGRGNDR